MSGSEFFSEMREQSEVKARIVANYFSAWAKIIKTHDKKFAYIDLYAGPGSYEDGSKSTPLKIIEKAIADPEIRSMLVSFFNDKEKKHAEKLDEAIKNLPGYDSLKFKPTVISMEVGKELEEYLKGMNLIPSFLFIDPWGYKGLTLELVDSVLRNWGCDCVFFFNYNRIKPALVNQKVDNHMCGLFGEARVKLMRHKLKLLGKRPSEKFIMEQLALALKDKGYKFIRHFRFVSLNRKIYYLVFVTKAFIGYHIMKEVMAKEGAYSPDGVPSYEYNPSENKKLQLFWGDEQVDELNRSLLKEYSGRELIVRQIYEKHSIDRPYVLDNYKEGLKKLEKDGKIECDPPADKRRPYRGELTMGDKVMIKFPKWEGNSGR